MTEQEFDALLEEVAGMLPERRMNFAPGMEAPKPQWVPDQNFNGLDPMTPAQREASRRAVADATFQQQAPGAAGVAAELTGIPSVARGQYQAYAGVNEGNPARVVKGMGETALGVSPYIPGYNLTTAALGLLGMQADDTMPGAQAAGREMPPLPVKGPPRPSQQPPAEVTTSVPPPQKPSTWQTAYDQVVNNANRAGEAISGLYEGISREWGQQEGPQSFDQWTAANAADRLKQAEALDRRASENIPGVNARTADRIRAQAATQAQEVRRSIQQDYQRYQDEEKRRGDMRFSERRPMTAAALMYGPIAAAGLRYRGALKRHANEVRGLTSAPATAANRELMRGTYNAPSSLPYIAGGIGGSMGGKAVGDFVDLYMVDPESKARKAAVDSYTTPEGIAGNVAGYATRAGLAGAAMPFAAMMAPRLSQLEKAKALRFADLPNPAAQSTRLGRFFDDYVMDRRARPTASSGSGGGASGVQSSSTRQQSTSQGSTSSQGQQGAGSSGRQQQTRQQGQGQQGARQSRQPSSNPATSFTSNKKSAVRAKFAENGGRITKSDFDAIAPGLSEKSRQAYVNRLEKAWKALGPEGFKRAIPYMAGVGGLAILPKQSD